MSLKEPFESLDDIRNAFNDILKRPIHRFTWHGNIVPRYMDGGLKIHVHIAFDSGNGACIVSSTNRKSSEIDFEPSALICGCLLLGDLSQQPRVENHCPVVTGGSEKRHSVFVRVYEIMQGSQRLIPGIVRLNELNLVNNRCGQLTVRKTIKPIRITGIGRAIKDGERGYSSVFSTCDDRRRDEIFGREFPHNIVKCGPGIRYAVSDNGTEMRGNILRQCCRMGNGINIIIGSDDTMRVSFQMSRAFGAKQFDVLFSPDDFEL
jgi:hypothetical protein